MVDTQRIGCSLRGTSHSEIRCDQIPSSPIAIILSSFHTDYLCGEKESLYVLLLVTRVKQCFCPSSIFFLPNAIERKEWSNNDVIKIDSSPSFASTIKMNISHNLPRGIFPNPFDELFSEIVLQFFWLFLSWTIAMVHGKTF